jgi:nucleotide-binding universal stress UspA family protein
MATQPVKVLIPLDGSQLAEHALAYVSALRPLGLSEVEVVSVIDPVTVPARRGHEDEERERNLLAAYQERLADRLRMHTTLDVKTRILSGLAPEAVLQEAEAYQPNYLIISTHGSSGLSRWRFGSVADKVIRGADCPTLVVGPVAAERDSWLEARLMPVFRSILVPLDGSELAEQALHQAQRFVEAFGAQLHLVTALVLGSMAANDAWSGASAKLTDELMTDSGEYLERIRARTPGLGDTTVAVRVGSPAETLSDYIADSAIDLVIMTSHGRGGLLRAALGSTTDRLLGGTAPVLIVRAREE